MLKKIFITILFISLPALAKDTLTVYTYSSFASEWGPGPVIKQAFEQRCDCTVNFVSLGDGAAILNRLKIEGKNSPADIVLGFDNNLMAAAEKTGLFSQHDIPLESLALPVKWDSNYFIPYDYSYFAFIYNKEKMPQPPSSMDELINSSANWKVIYQDPRTSTPGLGLLLWIKKLYGDDAPQVWQKLAQKTVTVTKGWSEAYGLFLKGEADLVLSYSSSPAYHIIDQNDNRYAAAIFKEGHYLQIEVAGLLANSKHPELAKHFMAFIISPEFQQSVVNKNWMYSVTGINLPKAFNDLAKPEIALEFTAEQVEQHRQAWIREWQNALVR